MANYRNDISPKKQSDQIVQRTKDQVFRNLGANTVILNLSNNRYYELNDVGTRIWQILECPVSINAICDTLIEEYEVNPDTCIIEVLALLKEMEENNLIESQHGED